jgi:hypothetical protein
MTCRRVVGLFKGTMKVYGDSAGSCDAMPALRWRVGI